MAAEPPKGTLDAAEHLIMNDRRPSYDQPIPSVRSRDPGLVAMVSRAFSQALIDARRPDPTRARVPPCRRCRWLNALGFTVAAKYRRARGGRIK